MPEQLVEVRIAVAADDHGLVAVELLDARTPVGDDLAQLRQDQVEELGDAQRAPERLGRRLERLGLRARGALGIEQASVLDRHRSLGGECRGEVRQLLGVEVGLELVDAQDADDTVADDHRRADPSANASTAVLFARERRVLRHVGENLSPLRPDDLTVQVGLVVQVEAHSDQATEILESAFANDHQAIALNHLDGGAVVGDHSLQLVEDRFEGLFKAQRPAEYLRYGQERLGMRSCALELGDVVVDRVEADVLAVDRQRHEHHLDVDQLPVLPCAASDPVGTTSLERLEVDVPALSAEVLVEDEVVDRAPDRLLRGIAKELRRRRVPARHSLVGVHDDDGDRTDLDERFQLV